MKVILLKDVPKVGKKFETKIISDGYALNFLIPRGLVEVATEKSISRVGLLQRQEEAQRKVHEDLLLKNLKSVEGVVITMTAKANDKGHLFAGIHSAEIAPEITAQTNVQILPDFIKLQKPIKETGDHEITVQAHDKTAKFTLHVQSSL